MKMLLLTLTLLIGFTSNTIISWACTPCQPLSNVSQNVNGNTLELNFTSNAGWQCCYTVRIEIVCANSNFTGIPNYLSQELCIAGGSCSSCTYNVPTPYATTYIDLSTFCPGTYKWRAAETTCNIYTPEYTFTIGGASPILLNASASQDSICTYENSQLNANASNGCNSNNFIYSWSPAAGLSNPNIANPVAAPSATTTYTLTVTESGSCTLPQTANLTITVNPTPTASVSGATDVCVGDSPPQLTITGGSGTAPYTINYQINGVNGPPIITNGNTATVDIPTGTSGTYNFSIIDVTDASTTECFQLQNSTATVNVSDLPIATINYLDNVYCATGSTPVVQTGQVGGIYSSTAGLSINPNTGEIDLASSTPGVYNVTYDFTDGICSNTTTDVISINPLPTATISGNTELCLNAASPGIIFTGANATAPYTISYTLNGNPQSAVITNGNNFTINVPTNTAGTFTYALVGVTDASLTQCTQNQTGNAVVVINPLPIVNAGEDQILCEPGSSTPSDVILSGSGAISYTWDNGVTNNVAFTPPPGTTVFTVTGTDANGCTDTDQVSVTSLPQPEANGAASVVYGNIPVPTILDNLSLYATNYVWDFGDGDSLVTQSTAGINYVYDTPGIYPVVLTASNGICQDTWTILIEAIPPMVVTPPNVFTPNGDNSNEEYFVNVLYGAQFEAVILNRWGNVMAELDQLNQGWDGKVNGNDAVEGVYFIKYLATDFSGVKVDGHTYFHLVR
jgi:gliding motility-associated-like protein